ncbi:ATP-binding protein [Clostridium sp. SYSU_GA19001]|uniref:sensor histidine kinase n=1 Tax=Clostridium caldaquaticum TaxID=2940653 RepID=UPI002076EDAD|nr:ATP-binding protein [Clostridium caldaquaticum]MCM8710263.1 ATP-binding protein [Clostridium caldaquaticum]
MDYSENNVEKNINSILAIVKLISLLFCVVIYSYEALSDSVIDFCDFKTSLLLIFVKIFIPLLIIVLLLWSYFYTNKYFTKRSKNIIIAENIIYMLFFSTLIFLSDLYESQYKFLFLFVIISSVIELGAKFGMAVAAVSSLIILSIDLISAPDSAVNIYFQSDLILVAALILVAWSLGRYVELQKENISKKDIQLNLLNDKLTEHEKRKIYIENIILKNEACYNLLINNTNNAILIHRCNKLIFSNESAAKLLGIPLEALIDKSILDFIIPEEKKSVEDMYLSVYEHKTGTITFEQILVGLNGIKINVLNTSSYFIYEGKPTILTILRDISPEKQVQSLKMDVQKNLELLNESREFNKLITDFFSNISHELKTPLNILFSSIQLLSLYSEDNTKFIENKDKYLGIMKQNCYRLMRLINNLLDITRADSGFLKPYMKNCNIISLVEDITMSVADFAESKGINLIFDTDCEEKMMAVDPDKIERIILNLLSNALKFTDCDGHILVTMLDKGDYIEISIKDDGIGIPEDKLDIIFERFRQVDKTLSRNHEGSGIGLSLVKTFVEMHEGTIKVNSQLYKGSEFIINLPVRVCSEDFVDKKYINDNIIEKISVEFSDIYS